MGGPLGALIAVGVVLIGGWIDSQYDKAYDKVSDKSKKKKNSNTYNFIFPIVKVPNFFYYTEIDDRKLYKKSKNQEQLNEDDELYRVDPLSIGGSSKSSSYGMLLALIPLSIPFFTEKVVERELKLLNLLLVFVIVLCMLFFGI